jgi:hypothetical protein
MDHPEKHDIVSTMLPGYRPAVIIEMFLTENVTKLPEVSELVSSGKVSFDAKSI